MNKDHHDHIEDDAYALALLDEYSEKRRHGEAVAQEPYIGRCPEKHQQELRSLMNTLVLADRALDLFREALVEDRRPQPKSDADSRRGREASEPES